ncbi:saccharopine dehydrogenase family protein [Haloechinothrix halophila]|uniref:saccharopine dehydrogenase family protein n=1 Tax=Haloechinothrix halophila TaxID=1069073 RepID=UPI00054EFEFA|nr:saccharopine dehydrogenase NADP-binding domain-containing protein [Haloechinothrix halophila]
MTKRIVFIGAAGEMCRVAIERFAKAGGDWKLELCDIRPETLESLARSLPAGRATTRRLDLFDRTDLRKVVDGAALVVLGAGPYIRTSEPVIEACLEAKAPYLDFDDDVESTEAALALHDRARKAGVPILLGCGASPGLTNVMTADAARDLDTVERIDVCWVTGDERPHPYGRAVLEHAVHIAAGPCVTWEHGQRVMHETFVETDVLPLGNTLGDFRLYESAHPEAVTMPRRWPDAQRIRVLGSLDPQPVNGILRGIGVAVQKGAMTMEEAIDFLDDIMTDGRGNAKGWRHALAGIWGQVRRGEVGRGEVLRYLADGLRRKHYTYRGINYTRLTGTRDGQRVVSVRRLPVSGPGTFVTSMAAMTGAATAAFMMLALDGLGGLAGVLAPEDWADPEAFYAKLELTGAQPHEIVESVVTPSSAVSRPAPVAATGA